MTIRFVEWQWVQIRIYLTIQPQVSFLGSPTASRRMLRFYGTLERDITTLECDTFEDEACFSQSIR